MTDAEPGGSKQWTLVEGLGAADPRDPAGDPGRPRPHVEVLARPDGLTVVSMTFRAGDVMDDHTAAAPILVLGVRGEIEFTVGGETIALTPGRAVHVAPRVTHRLSADADAAATLLVLTGMS